LFCLFVFVWVHWNAAFRVRIKQGVSLKRYPKMFFQNSFGINGSFC